MYGSIAERRRLKEPTLYNGEMILPPAIFLSWDYVYVKTREKFHFNF